MRLSFSTFSGLLFLVNFCRSASISKVDRANPQIQNFENSVSNHKPISLSINEGSLSLYKKSHMPDPGDNEKFDPQSFWKWKHKDCEDEDENDWPKKIIYIKFDQERGEPISVKKLDTPSPLTFFSSSSIKDWLYKLLEDDCVKEDDNSVYDQEGRIIFIAFTNSEPQEEEIKRYFEKDMEVKEILQRYSTQAKENLVVVLTGDVDGSHLEIESNHLTHAAHTLREISESSRQEKGNFNSGKHDFELKVNSRKYHLVSLDKDIFRSTLSVSSFERNITNSTEQHLYRDSTSGQRKERQFIQDTRNISNSTIRLGDLTSLGTARMIPEFSHIMPVLLIVFAL